MESLELQALRPSLRSKLPHREACKTGSQQWISVLARAPAAPSAGGTEWACRANKGQGPPSGTVSGAGGLGEPYEEELGRVFCTL